MQSFSTEEYQRLQDALAPGESILWTGKPATQIIFHDTDLFQIPFSLVWGGFALFWELGVAGYGPMLGHDQQGPWSFGMLWGIPFNIIGQYMIWGRFFYAAWKKKRVLYAITNRRAIVDVRPPQSKLISIYLENIPSLERTIRPDGIGTIFFGEKPSVFGNRSSRNNSFDNLYLNSRIPVFVDILDAAQVATLIESQRRAAIVSRA